MLQPARVSTGTTSLTKLMGRSAAYAGLTGQANPRTPARDTAQDQLTDVRAVRLVPGGISIPLRCQVTGGRQYTRQGGRSAAGASFTSRIGEGDPDCVRRSSRDTAWQEFVTDPEIT